MSGFSSPKPGTVPPVTSARKCRSCLSGAEPPDNHEVSILTSSKQLQSALEVDWLIGLLIAFLPSLRGARIPLRRNAFSESERPPLACHPARRSHTDGYPPGYAADIWHTSFRLFTMSLVIS